MTRSYRRTPVAGITKSESEKADKVRAHRRLRRIVRCKVFKFGDDTVLPDVREIENVYSWDKDGKMRFDPRVYPELMRK